MLHCLYSILPHIGGIFMSIDLNLLRIFSAVAEQAQLPVLHDRFLCQHLMSVGQ